MSGWVKYASQSKTVLFEAIRNYRNWSNKENGVGDSIQQGTWPETPLVMVSIRNPCHQPLSCACTRVPSMTIGYYFCIKKAHRLHYTNKVVIKSHVCEYHPAACPTFRSLRPHVSVGFSRTLCLGKGLQKFQMLVSREPHQPDQSTVPWGSTCHHKSRIDHHVITHPVLHSFMKQHVTCSALKVQSKLQEQPGRSDSTTAKKDILAVSLRITENVFLSIQGSLG